MATVVSHSMRLDMETHAKAQSYHSTTSSSEEKKGAVAGNFQIRMQVCLECRLEYNINICFLTSYRPMRVEVPRRVNKIHSATRDTTATLTAKSNEDAVSCLD